MACPGIAGLHCLSQSVSFGPFSRRAAKCPGIARHACQAVHHDGKRPTAAPLDYDYRKATASRTREIVRDRFPELTDLADAGTLVCLIRTGGEQIEQSVTEHSSVCSQPRSTDGDSAGEAIGDGVTATPVAMEPTSARGRDVLDRPPPAREIFLIGTAHVSRRSARDVRRVVEAVRPDNVVVELCASRSALMYQVQQPPDQPVDLSNGNVAAASRGAGEKGTHRAGSLAAHGLPVTDTANTEREAGEVAGGTDRGGSDVNDGNVAVAATAGSMNDRVNVNPLLLSGQGGLLETLTQSLQRGGRSAMALRLLLSLTAHRASQAAGVQTGVEFCAAREAAEAVGAQLVLGDRPIEITLKRAWAALSFSQKLRFAAVLLRGSLLASSTSSPLSPDPFSEESLSQLQSQDGQLSAMFRALGSEFPSLLPPLVHERDAYMAWVLRYSRAVRGCERVVGVVGSGHLPGIIHCLLEDDKERVLWFKQVAGRQEDGERGIRKGGLQGALSRPLIIRVIVELTLGVAVWYAWDLVS